MRAWGLPRGPATFLCSGGSVKRTSHSHDPCHRTPTPPPAPRPRDALFWEQFVSVGYKNESYIQNGLIVATINPNAVTSATGGAVFAPQNEFWLAGPLTIVNYKDIGALRGCASVSGDWWVGGMFVTPLPNCGHDST